MTARRPGEELYDLREDPFQMNNVAADADYAQTLKELRERLTDYLVRLFNVCLRPQGYAISAEVDAELRRRVQNACADGEPLVDLLDKLPTMPRMRAAEGYADDLPEHAARIRRARAEARRER